MVVVMVVVVVSYQVCRTRGSRTQTTATTSTEGASRTTSTPSWALEENKWKLCPRYRGKEKKKVAFMQARKKECGLSLVQRGGIIIMLVDQDHRAGNSLNNDLVALANLISMIPRIR